MDDPAIQYNTNGLKYECFLEDKVLTTYIWDVCLHLISLDFSKVSWLPRVWQDSCHLVLHKPANLLKSQVVLQKKKKKKTTKTADSLLLYLIW